MAWTFSFSTELNPITIYLAVVATGVAAWQVYTYFRDGPHLRLTAGGNQIIAGTTGPTIFIGVSAVNIGNRTTIIQSVGMRVYDNWWQWFRRRGSKDIFFGIARGNSVPPVLEPDHTFLGFVVQTPKLAKRSREKRAYMLVSHSVGKRPLPVRLKPIGDVKVSAARPQRHN
jgi:hypothetical protein